MRDAEGEEIIDPGIYDLGGGRTLTVWATQDDTAKVTLWACTLNDHGPFCRLCQEVDGVLNALLVNVIDGRMDCSQDTHGEFRFRVTEAGLDAVRQFIDGD